MVTMTADQPTADATDKTIAAIAAGHRMADMPLTGDDQEALRRIAAGETTIEQERDRLIAQLTDNA